MTTNTIQRFQPFVVLDKEIKFFEIIQLNEKKSDDWKTSSVVILINFQTKSKELFIYRRINNKKDGIFLKNIFKLHSYSKK